MSNVRLPHLTRLTSSMVCITMSAKQNTQQTLENHAWCHRIRVCGTRVWTEYGIWYWTRSPERAAGTNDDVRVPQAHTRLNGRADHNDVVSLVVWLRR